MYGTLDADPTIKPLRGGTHLRGRPSLEGRQQPSHARRSIKELPGVMHNNRPVLTEILGSTKPKHHEEDEDGFAISRTKKSFVYTMLNPRSNERQADIFKWFITIVIVADLFSFVVSTEPDITEKQMEFFHMWEGVTSSIFLIEYVARLVVVTESRKYGSMGMLRGRLRYMVTLNAIVDAVSTLPYFLEFVTGLDLPTLTFLRSFRLLRILKTSGFSEATRSVGRVIYYNSQILYVALLIGIGLILITSVLMYYLRPRNTEDAQAFKSLASTMYLSTMMLTGQGGPDGDLPWYTSGVVLLTGVFSIGMFAIPASMLTWGFEAEAERYAKRAYLREKAPNQATDYDAWSFSSEDYSTDEEYRKIITGDDGEESDEEGGSARMNFHLADTDGSGQISLREFLELSRAQQAERIALAGVATETDGLTNEVTARIAALEHHVKENSKKLDKMYQVMQAIEKKL